MSSDPRQVQILIENLVDDTRRLVQQAAAGADAARAHLLQVEEQSETMHRYAVAVGEDARHLAGAVEQCHATVGHARTDAHAARDRSDHATTEAENALGAAQSALHHWTGRLDDARAWQRSAERREEEARSAVARAQRDVDTARAEERYAAEALNRCENSGYRDKDGRWHQPNCSGEIGAYARCQANLAEARRILQIAEAELDEAERDLARARETVAICTENVHLCEDAVAQAHQATQEAARARDHAADADRAVDEAADAARIAERHSRDAATAAESALAGAVAADVEVRAARDEWTRASGAAGAALDAHHRGRREADDLVDLLRDFDTPRGLS